jgi:protease I
MDKPLAGKTIAILLASGFEEEQITSIQRELLAQGAKLHLISNDQGLVNAWRGQGWGLYFPVDKAIAEVLAADYDGLYLPGGARSVQKLRQSAHTKRLLRHFVEAGKAVVAVAEAVSLFDLLAPLTPLQLTLAAPQENAQALAEHGAQITPENISQSGSVLTVRSYGQVENFVNLVLESFLLVNPIAEAA